MMAGHAARYSGRKADWIGIAWLAYHDGAGTYRIGGVSFKSWIYWHFRTAMRKELGKKNTISLYALPCAYAASGGLAYELDVDRLLLSIDREKVPEILKRLTPAESKVLRMRFGIDGQELTLMQTGEILGISAERVRQIQAEALSKLTAILRAGE